MILKYTLNLALKIGSKTPLASFKVLRVSPFSESSVKIPFHGSPNKTSPNAELSSSRRVSISIFSLPLTISIILPMLIVSHKQIDFKN